MFNELNERINIMSALPVRLSCNLMRLYSRQILIRDNQSDLSERSMTFYERERA